MKKGKKIAKITLCIIVAILGCIAIVWHIIHVVVGGYSVYEIFNWGTWMNQNLLVIIGVFVFLELLILIIFRNTKKATDENKRCQAKETNSITNILD